MSADLRLSQLQNSLQQTPYSNRVGSLCIRKEEGIREHPTSLEIDKDKGVMGDRWIWRCWKELPDGSSDPRVQVSLSNSRIISQLQKEKRNPYHPGDNIMVDCNLCAAFFPVAKQFRVGTVLLEVSDVFNDACAKFAGEFGKEVIRWINLPDHRSLNLRGIYCRVIESGTVKLDDPLQIELA